MIINIWKSVKNPNPSKKEIKLHYESMLPIIMAIIKKTNADKNVGRASGVDSHH